MTLRGTVGNKIDANLIPENIRKDKTIFGVEGNFEGGIGGLTMINKWIPYGTLVSLANNSNDQLPIGYRAFKNDTNETLVLYPMTNNPYGSPGSSYVYVYKLDKVLGTFTRLSGNGSFQTQSTNATITEIKVDGDDMYVSAETTATNPSNYGNVYKYVISTNTRSTIWSGTKQWFESRDPLLFPYAGAGTIITGNEIIDGTQKLVFSGEIWPSPYPSSRAWYPLITIENI